MIRINLLHDPKIKRAAPGEQTLAIGMGILAIFGLLIYVFVHAGIAADVEKAAQSRSRLQRAIDVLKEETKDFDLIKQQADAVRQQQAAIDSLNGARAVPAWLLRELSNILTKDHKPTMTADMSERVRQDPNRRWSNAWDPKRVWLESFVEKGGVFTLKGGAQSDQDVTELALRMQASVFFDKVVPEGGSSATDNESKVAYYHFTIKGEVRY